MTDEKAGKISKVSLSPASFSNFAAHTASSILHSFTLKNFFIMYNCHAFLMVFSFFRYCFMHERKKIKKVCPRHFDFFFCWRIFAFILRLLIFSDQNIQFYHALLEQVSYVTQPPYCGSRNEKVESTSARQKKKSTPVI